MDYHMQFLEFLSLLKKHALSYAICGISFPSPKTWNLICNISNFFPFSKNMDYHMQFLKYFEFLSKTLTIICNFWNFFPFSKNMDYHMKFLKFHSHQQKRGLSYVISEFLSLLKKRGLSYAILENSFISPKT